MITLNLQKALPTEAQLENERRWKEEKIQEEIERDRLYDELRASNERVVLSFRNNLLPFIL